jgi:O-antigen ligase
MDGFRFEKVNQALYTLFSPSHVNYGALLAALLPVAVAFYWLSEKIHRQIMRFALLLLLVALVCSFSRGAWLAVFISIITVWAVRKKIMVHLLLLAILSSTAVFIGLGSHNTYLDYRPDFKKTIFHTNFQEHLAATCRGQDLSTAERFYRWTAVKQMLYENPITGVGPNNFYDTYKAYTAAAYKTWVSDNKEHSTVHNYFFLLLTEQGLPGLAIFFYCCWHCLGMHKKSIIKKIGLAANHGIGHCCHAGRYIDGEFFKRFNRNR